MANLAKWFAVVLLTLASGYADSRGFVHSSRMWDHGTLVWPELVRAALAFGAGYLPFWLGLRFATDLGVVSAEVQTLGWFVVTMAGVAILSGEMQRWPAIDKAVAAMVLLGMGWLLLRGRS